MKKQPQNQFTWTCTGPGVPYLSLMWPTKAKELPTPALDWSVGVFYGLYYFSLKKILICHYEKVEQIRPHLGLVWSKILWHLQHICRHLRRIETEKLENKQLLSWKGSKRINKFVMSWKFPVACQPLLKRKPYTWHINLEQTNSNYNTTKFLL